MNTSERRDVGAYLKVRSVAAAALTAGGSGDNTAFSGTAFDKSALGTFFGSGIAVVSGRAVLGEGETLSITVELLDGPAANTATAVYEEVADDVVVATGGSGGSTEHFMVQYKVPLDSMNQFVNVKVTPDLSRANTDTAVVHSGIVLGGPKTVPIA